MANKFDKIPVNYTIVFNDDMSDISFTKTFLRMDLELAKHTALAESIGRYGYTPSSYDKIENIRLRGKIYPSHRIALVEYDVNLKNIMEAN